MKNAIFLTIFLLQGSLCAAQGTRYFKAEHGVAATYLRLASDGEYKVIDREHAGILLTDEGRWQQTGAVITFMPKDSKIPQYQVTENKHKRKTYLAIITADAAAGIVIPVEQINKSLDTDPRNLPDHVFFSTTAKTYDTETRQAYSFRYLHCCDKSPSRN